MSQYLKTILQLILTKLQQGKSNKFPVLVTQYFALFVGLYGGQAFFDYLNQVSPGVALTLLVQVWIPKAKNATQNSIDAKCQVVGLTRLLCDTPALLQDDNGKQIWAQTLAATVAILTSSTFSTNDADDEEPEVEVAYDATFTQLSLATKKANDPFANVPDPVDMFCKSLEKLSSSQPGVLPPIIQLGLNSDPKLQSGFQSLVQKAGVRL
jgi:exportin-2 (importin alpha re-exporter)